MILSGTTPKERADTISKFQRVADVLLTLRNYNTLMAVIGALSGSSVCRLSRTQRAVPVTVHSRISELTSLLSAKSNYNSYRKLLHTMKGGECFHLPIL